MSEDDLDNLYNEPGHYDAKYAGIVEDIPFYIDMVREHGEPALELMCGTGRVTIPMAQEGFDVVGIDRSKTMLDHARRKAGEAGVEIPWIEGDIRGIQVGRRFRTIMVPFNSILHLGEVEEFEMVFQLVRDHIADDGVFIMDIFNPNLDYLTGDQPIDVEQAHSGYPDPDTGEPVRILENKVYDKARQVNHITWNFRSGEHGREWVDEFDIRVMFPQELKLLMKAMDFEIIKIYGDYDQSPFTSDSPKQIVVCRPKGRIAGRNVEDVCTTDDDQCDSDAGAE